MAPKDSACKHQKDYYDANDEYVKSICTIKENLTWSNSALRCAYIDARIADPYNTPEAGNFLLERVAECSDEKMLWTGNSSTDGKCMAVISSATNQTIEERKCNESYYAYCEFNSKLKRKLHERFE
jgi:hypothetical protein